MYVFKETPPDPGSDGETPRKRRKLDDTPPRSATAAGAARAPRRRYRRSASAPARIMSVPFSGVVSGVGVCILM